MSVAAQPAGYVGVLGVVGARGGAGASCLAVALARSAARQGWPTLLLDLDPLGGGLDLVLGCEDEPGLRFGASPVRPDDVVAHLMADLSLGRPALIAAERTPVGGSGPPAGPSGAELRDVLDRVRDEALVVLDLPRRPARLAELAGGVDVVLLLAPSEIRACAAGAAVRAALTGCPDVRLVARGPAPGHLAGTVVADALGLPLAGVLRPEPGLAAALERGEPPGRSRGPLARFCAGFLRDLSRDRDRDLDNDLDRG